MNWDAFRSIALLLVTFSIAQADERRAPAPTYSPDQLRGVFFDDIGEAIRGDRPSLSSLRKSATAESVAESKPADGGDSKSGGWVALISPTSIEDEIKRMRLHFDSVITSPGEFRGGGYQTARLDLMVMATLFAVINEYPDDVRWKDQAAIARDLLARTAFNCKSGDTQVYNEAKQRKIELQDLVSGSGLNSREADAENDWSMIAARSPMMEYAEQLIETLEGNSRDVTAVEQNADSVRRFAELIAVVGEVITKEGMDEADDDDYVQLSHDMITEARTVVEAIERSDYEAARLGVSGIRARCDACHEQYR